ncbi:LVIVD repeat-containing protein [Sinimarinibacterium thermocellulolyticum]|uniref:LVIVD repeat-containing protein n=1 Tax=Sinimarinibacterium thermocellulolyticum TaxID=3170016 RepID=A0ABV2A8B9_9GAMM
MTQFGLRPALASLLLLLGGCGSSDTPGPSTIPENGTMLADCGPGSRPETGLQGQVPIADRQSGRNLLGYSCNLELVGQYQGVGASIVNPAFDTCAYLATSGVLIDPLQLLQPNPGVHVVDARDPTRPVLATTLTAPAMAAGTWESLKVNAARELLGGVAVGPLVGGAFFDVYDISDCAKPVHLNGIGGTSLSFPSNVLGHEGNWAPDGMTYWATGLVGGSITAIDTRDPASPRIIYTGLKGIPANHGAEFSADGNTMYLATCFPGGVTILDVSEVQARKPAPQVRQIGSLTWNATSCAQHAIPVSWNGRPHLIVADEFNSEGVRIVDIVDPAEPKVVKQIQLQIQFSENADLRRVDVAGNGAFGYEAHYCSVDRHADPTALACGYFQSGIRVFDIRDPLQVREIAYYNPPAQTGKGLQLQHSLHAWVGGVLPTISDLNSAGSDSFAETLMRDVASVVDYVAALPGLLDDLGSGPVSGNLSADWCSSPPQFVDGRIWVSCMDNGFMVLAFTNGVYPIREPLPRAR